MITVSPALGVVLTVYDPVPAVALVVRVVPFTSTPVLGAKQKLDPMVMLAVAALARLAVKISDPPIVAVWPLVGSPVTVPVCVAAVPPTLELRNSVAGEQRP